MRKNVLLLSSMALAVLLACGAALFGATEPVEAAEPQVVPDAACPQNQGPLNGQGFGVGDLPGVVDGGVPWSQTFTAIRTGKLTSAQVLIRDGSPVSQVGDVVIQIRKVDASGVPTNRVLASTVVPASELVPNPGPPFLFITVTANFGRHGAASVVAGQRYALYVTTSGTPDFYSVVTNANNPCEGTLYVETSMGFVNSGPLGGDPGNPEGDMIFATYVTPTPANTTPTTKADCKKGGYKDFGFKNKGWCIKAVKNPPQTKADCKKGGYKDFGFKNKGWCIKVVKNKRT
jgi:hypothetical protein